MASGAAGIYSFEAESECALRMSFETSEPAASDTSLPTRLHLLILTTHFHQLSAINMQAYGYHSHSNHHNVWLRIEWEVVIAHHHFLSCFLKCFCNYLTFILKCFKTPDWTMLPSFQIIQILKLNELFCLLFCPSTLLFLLQSHPPPPLPRHTSLVTLLVCAQKVLLGCLLWLVFSVPSLY